jgi:hypothetical protein
LSIIDVLMWNSPAAVVRHLAARDGCRLSAEQPPSQMTIDSQ